MYEKGVPLYFYFIRYCVFYFILVLLVIPIAITIFNTNSTEIAKDSFITFLFEINNSINLFLVLLILQKNF